MRKAGSKKEGVVGGTAKGRRRRAGTRAPKRGKTVGEINRWMSANYAEVMEAARENCVGLTGKPTLGGAVRPRRRKSA